MRLLLVGASGFLGKHFLLRYSEVYEITALYRREDFPAFLKSHDLNSVRAIRCELTDCEQIRQELGRAGREWDLCLYLASRVDIPGSVVDPRPDLHDNVCGLLNLLLEIECGRFMYLSSGAVYDGCKGQVSPETPVSPTLPYAIGKLAAESYVRYCRQRRGNLAAGVILRFFGAYGELEPAHKIFTKLAKAFGIDRQDVFTIYGDGTNLIDAMHVSDAVEILHRGLQGGTKDVVLDVCCGRPIQIEDLVRAAARLLGCEPVRIAKVGRAHECVKFFASPQDFQDAFGFVPRVPLEQGLPRLVEHLKRAG